MEILKTGGDGESLPETISPLPSEPEATAYQLLAGTADAGCSLVKMVCTAKTPHSPSPEVINRECSPGLFIVSQVTPELVEE